MSDQNSGLKEEAVETPQEEAKPTSNQHPEVQSPIAEGEDLSPEAQEEQEALANSKNPERTRAYIEKLKSQIKKQEQQELPTQETGENYGTSVFDSFASPAPVAPQQPPVQQQGYGYLSQPQVENIAKSFIDEAGNVDIQGLNQELARANFQAQQAIAEARATRERIVRFEEDVQLREAYKEFPQLNPLKKETFDPTFFKLVRGMLTEDMVRNSGRQKLSLIDAARELERNYRTPRQREESAQEVQQRQTQRRQGPIEDGRGQTRSTGSTIQELRERTRQGDPRALEERLRNLGVVKD